jgi:leucyl aminopeptidase (aminopeptidase T)
MGVSSQDRVVIVTDEARSHIGAALADACQALSAPELVLKLEDHMTRPAAGYPESLSKEIEDFSPTVSLFAATALNGELAFRRPYMDHVLYGLKLRHGHMVGIDDRVMEEGMAADYAEISKVTARVTEIVKGAREIHVKTPSGTDMRARFDPDRLRWRPCPGIFHEPGDWGNLPEGETFTSPASVDGVFGAEVLGDHFSSQYGVLSPPVIIEIEKSRARKVTSGPEGLAEELTEYLGKHENSDRVGEYAIGTNIALDHLCGNLLQDEKVPGVHIAFGYPYPEETGADWNCPSHVDAVAVRSTIKVDGQLLMEDGKFLL